MRHIFCLAVGTFVLMGAASTATAQPSRRSYRPYQPSRPTMTPYLDYFRRDVSAPELGGALTRYHTQVRPRQNFRDSIQTQSRGLQGLSNRYDQRFKQVESEIKELTPRAVRPPGISPTGIGAGFGTHHGYFGGR